MDNRDKERQFPFALKFFSTCDSVIGVRKDSIVGPVICWPTCVMTKDGDTQARIIGYSCAIHDLSHEKLVEIDRLPHQN